MCGLGKVTVATMAEDRVQYALRANPDFQALAEDIPDPSAMSPRTALLVAGLLLGITVMVAAAAAVVWKDKLFGESEQVVAPSSGAGLVAPPPVGTPAVAPEPSHAEAPHGDAPRPASSGRAAPAPKTRASK